MTNRVVVGFADELTKEAGVAKALGAISRGLKKTQFGKTSPARKFREFAARYQRSPEFRHAIGRSATLGGATGAVGGAMSGGDDGFVEKVLRGAAIGTIGGVATGAYRPGWFGSKSGVAQGEKITNLGRKATKRTAR